MLGGVRSGLRVKGSKRPQMRELGQRLADTLRQNNGTIDSPARLQALVADLVAERQELLLPLRDLVARPAFQALIPRAGSGGGAMQRDVLIQDMGVTFSLPVIAAIGELLDGFLDLPPGSAAQPEDRAMATAQVRRGRPTRAGASSPTPAPPPIRLSRPALQPPPAPPPQPRAARPPERGISATGLVLLSLFTALVVAGGVVVVRTTNLCSLVGLCAGAGDAAGVAEALRTAQRAEQALSEAPDLGAYEQAVVALEQQLLLLTNARLTPGQERRRNALDQVARDARGVLAEEMGDVRRLEKASRALASARQSSGEERTALLASANQELEAIPPRSFSAPQAKRLRAQLEQVAQEAVVSEPPEVEQPAIDPAATPGEQPIQEQESGPEPVGSSPPPVPVPVPPPITPPPPPITPPPGPSETSTP